MDGHLVGQGHGKGTTEEKVLAGEQLGFTPRRGVQTKSSHDVVIPSGRRLLS